MSDFQGCRAWPGNVSHYRKRNDLLCKQRKIMCLKELFVSNYQDANLLAVCKLSGGHCWGLVASGFCDVIKVLCLLSPACEKC